MEFRIFDTVVFDAKTIGGKSSMPFFDETEDNEDSVTNYQEHELVKWLMSHRHFRALFVQKFFSSPENVKIQTRVTFPFVTLNQKPGDVDLLLVHPAHPHQAIAFEVKRIKVTAIDDNTTRINGKEKIKKAVIQANAYQSLGFHQTYLLLIILNDGRAKTTKNVILRAANSPDVQRIYDIPWNESLHRDVGIVCVDVCQFTGRSIAQTGSFGICVDKAAVPLQQSIEMTNKIRIAYRN